MVRILFAALLATFMSFSASAREITVTYYGALFYGAPYAIAMEKGYFSEAGVDITGVLTSAGGATTVRNTLAGSLPFGEVALPAALQAIKSGEDLKIIGTGVNTSDEIVWLTKADAPYKTWQDLKGLPVGVTSLNGVGHMLTLMSLEQAGMTVDDIKLVVGGGSGATLAAVKQGTITTAPLSLQAWLKEQPKGDVKPLFWVHDLMNPVMTQTVLVTTDEFAKAEPETLRSILSVRRKAVAEIYADPDASATIVAKVYNMDVEEVKGVFRELVKIKEWSDGGIDYYGMNRMIEGMKLVGTLTEPVDWSKVVDSTFIDSLPAN